MSHQLHNLRKSTNISNAKSNKLYYENLQKSCAFCAKSFIKDIEKGINYR